MVRGQQSAERTWGQPLVVSTAIDFDVFETSIVVTTHFGTRTANQIVSYWEARVFRRDRARHAAILSIRTTAAGGCRCFGQLAVVPQLEARHARRG